MELNRIVKLEPPFHHSSLTDQRVASDWLGGDYEFVFNKQNETPPLSSGANGMDTLSDYAPCIPVTSNSLDSSTGLNSSCSTLDLNGSSGHHQEHQLQQQPSQLTFHTLTHSDQLNGLHAQSSIQSQSQEQSCRGDLLSSSSSSPSLNPIDMREQEKFKLDRKRQRNREAASKCRKRKIEKIQTLEERVKQVKSLNSKLEASILEYRDKLELLNQELIKHAKCGCRMSQSLEYLLLQK